MADHEDDTPRPDIGPPLSAIAVILYDLATNAASVTVNLREAARSVDRLEGIARENLSVDLQRILRRFGDLSLEAADALRDGKL